MKKIKVIIVLLMTCLLLSCDLSKPEYLHWDSKKNNYYYTNELYSKLNNNNFSIKVFDTNLYKNIEVNESENKIVENFIHSLTHENFQEDGLPQDIEPYQLRISFEDGSKYIINVYSYDIISLYPWDGNYKEDIINMTNIPQKYNLYDFCKHIDKESKNAK
ncbi:MAG: DUF4883 family protein [Clostridiaceae bacterium]|nr:DUF4883 family protein [Clostridiaceae bacterium]